MRIKDLFSIFLVLIKLLRFQREKFNVMLSVLKTIESSNEESDSLLKWNQLMLSKKKLFYDIAEHNSLSELNDIDTADYNYIGINTTSCMHLKRIVFYSKKIGILKNQFESIKAQLLNQRIKEDGIALFVEEDYEDFEYLVLAGRDRVQELFSLSGSLDRDTKILLTNTAQLGEVKKHFRSLGYNQIELYGINPLSQK